MKEKEKSLWKSESLHDSKRSGPPTAITVHGRVGTQKQKSYARTSPHSEAKWVLLSLLYKWISYKFLPSKWVGGEWKR